MMIIPIVARNDAWAARHGTVIAESSSPLKPLPLLLLLS